MPKLSRTARRRNVAIEGAKILVTSAAVIATVGGWAAISLGDAAPDTTSVAQVVVAAPTATPSAGASGTITNTNLAAPSATVAPTATAAPTQAPLPTQRVRIRTRSSR